MTTHEPPPAYRPLTHIKWAARLDGMVRKPIVDLARQALYVIIYREKTRSYLLGAYELGLGKVQWETEVANGGYGTPAQSPALVVMPHKFTDVIAIRKGDGSVAWQHRGTGRVRSTILFHEGVFYFSCGGQIFGLDTDGAVAYRAQHPTAFFYGEPIVEDGVLYTLGVAPSGGRSIRSLYCYDRRGELLHAHVLGEGGVISSDVAGVLHVGVDVVAAGPGYLVRLCKRSGQVRWRSEVRGDPSRHACTSSAGRVFYTTLDGVVGALDMTNGKPIWERAYNESIWTPATTVGEGTIGFAADGFLYHLSAADGLLISKRPVGHSPYSALVIVDEHALIGAGEPPYDGLLISFADAKPRSRPEITLAAHNAILGSAEVDFVLSVPEGVRASTMRVSVAAFSTVQEATPVETHGDRALFRVPLDSQCTPGDYAMLVTFRCGDGEVGTDVVLLSVTRAIPLPNKVFLSSVAPFAQERLDYSGAAVAQMLESHYGYPRVEQTQRRRMIDYVRERSGYHPFDTWRILFRRVMATGATRPEELPEYRSDASTLNQERRV